MSNSASEVMRPHLDGWHVGDNFKQGTGGHGDTVEVYTQTFTKVLSLLKKQKMKFDTGKTKTITKKSKTKKGEDKKELVSIYYDAEFQPARASIVDHVGAFSPLIQSAFLDIGFKLNDSILCYDLMKWKKDKNNNDVEVKMGLSFVIGNYEVRLIKGRHAMLYKNKIVRTFKGCKWTN